MKLDFRWLQSGGVMLEVLMSRIENPDRHLRLEDQGRFVVGHCRRRNSRKSGADGQPTAPPPTPTPTKKTPAGFPAGVVCVCLT